MTTTKKTGQYFANSEDTQAVIPTFTPLQPDYQKQSKAISEVKSKGMSETDKAIGSLVYSKGWQEVEDFIKNLVGDLERSVTTAIDSKMSLQEIGERAIVAKLTREELQKILDFVYARHELLKSATT